MLKYHIDVFYSEVDEGYIANIPDLEHCSAFGKTPKIALREVLIAQELWIESARENGLKIPESTYRPLYNQIDEPQRWGLADAGS